MPQAFLFIYFLALGSSYFALKNVMKITVTSICNLNVCTLNIPCTDSRVRGFFFPPSFPPFPSLKTRPASTVISCVCLFIFIFILFFYLCLLNFKNDNRRICCIKIQDLIVDLKVAWLHSFYLVFFF